MSSFPSLFASLEENEWANLEAWNDPLMPTPAVLPAVQSPADVRTRAQRNISNLRAHVAEVAAANRQKNAMHFAMLAFQGSCKPGGLVWGGEGGGGVGGSAVWSGAGSASVGTLERESSTGACSATRSRQAFASPTRSAVHSLSPRGTAPGSLSPRANAGGDIDNMLNSRYEAGASVLGTELENEWNIPDLNLIFKPPKFLTEISDMSDRISPGKWAQVAPGRAAVKTQGARSRAKWKMMKNVINSGLALKQGAEEADLYTEGEREEKKRRLQLEVEQLKYFLLSITTAWQELSEPDMDIRDMQPGGAGDEPVEPLTRRGSSPMRAQSSSTTTRPPTWSGASPAAHTQDTWSEVRGAPQSHPSPHPSPHPSQNASHALLNNGKLLVNGHSLVSQEHMCNIEMCKIEVAVSEEQMCNMDICNIEDSALPAAVAKGGGLGHALGAVDIKALDYRVPQRSDVSVKGIATGICQLLQADGSTGLIDVDALALSIVCPYPSQSAEVQITEVCGKAQGSKIPERSRGKQDECAGGVLGVGGEGGVGGSKSSNANRLNYVCAFKMRVVGGGDNVTMRIWANGKTQTSGCKDRAMLLAVNECVCRAILNLSANNVTQGLPSVIRGDVMQQQQAFAQLSDPSNIHILSAHIIGSWNLDLKAVGANLDMGALCEFLASERFSDRVFKVSHVKREGNAARFNNLSLYIQRQCLTKWKADGSDQTTVYVNIYNSGKCSVLAAPDEEVAEELANVVCQMLLEAIQEPSVRINVTEASVPPSAKRNSSLGKRNSSGGSKQRSGVT